jgi:hypothetical protein
MLQGISKCSRAVRFVTWRGRCRRRGQVFARAVERATVAALLALMRLFCDVDAHGRLPYIRERVR